MKKAKSEVKVPEMHEIVYIDTAGNKITTMSTYGEPGQEIKLEVDHLTHPAWKKDSNSNAINARVDQVVKFEEKNKDLMAKLNKMFG